MAGDMADDEWAAGFEQDQDEKAAIRALTQRCKKARRCPRAFFYNDDGLFECPTCGNMTDL
jgi:hypothetical protein